MRRDANIIGPQLIKLRYQRGWTQEELAVQLEAIGFAITRDVIANLESRRTTATDRQIECLCVVFDVSADKLFPPRLPRLK